ncbi:hypothetical protein GIY62_14755 [Burkholderia plantarii]|uniref:hypothetical protein n=1 Tax=Burkholderia plantarii TaxID=41899 RepID=UPI00272D21D2|nr:hypothetical protein [Burkholderia plantarii]WLE58387.1 hypothetical protein GIY62_14755 [Burkholderia plantarii]
MSALLSQSAPASAGVLPSGETMFQEFPMWVTSDAGESRLVETDDAFIALGKGWKKPERAKPVPREKQPDYAEYPKWVGGKIVHSAAEEAALAPAEPVGADSPPPLDEADERAALLQIAEEKGVRVDKRWSNEKIRNALEMA